MTCKEKLTMDNPENVRPSYMGGCLGCPHTYGYIPKPKECNTIQCEACWERRLPTIGAYHTFSFPVEGEAVQWTGRNYSEVRKFLNGKIRIRGVCANPTLIIHMDAGKTMLPVGWWIVKECKSVGFYDPKSFSGLFDIQIEHLLDITTSWEFEELEGRRRYMIAPGYTFADLTPYEQKLLVWSEAYEKRKNGE